MLQGITVVTGVVGAIFTTTVALIIYFLSTKREERKTRRKEVYEPLLNNVNAVLRMLPLWEQIKLSIWENDAAIRTKLEKDDKKLFGKMKEFYGYLNEYNSHIAIHKMKLGLKGSAAYTSDIKKTVNTIEEKIALMNELGEELIGKLRKKL